MHNQSIMSTFPDPQIRLKYLAVARVSQYYNKGETRGHGADFYVNIKSVLKAFWSKDISDRTKSSRSIPWPNVERSNCCWSWSVWLSPFFFPAAAFPCAVSDDKPYCL